MAAPTQHVVSQLTAQMHLAYRVYADAPCLQSLCREGAVKEKREAMPWGNFIAHKFQACPNCHFSNAAGLIFCLKLCKIWS